MTASAAVADGSNSQPAAACPGTSGRSSDGRPVAVLVIGNPEAPELQALGPKMPAGAVLLGIGVFAAVRGDQQAQDRGGLQACWRLQLQAMLCCCCTGQTLQDFSGLSEEQWASVEVVVKLGGGGSSIAAAKWQREHKHLSRCNSSSVSLTLPLEVNMNTPPGPEPQST